jgi:murein biosynthesis integral membrane protein MurJ
VVRHTSGTSVAAALGVASGLLLDVVIAASFGAGTATDAFFVAARIPLGIAAILLVGANQALVPAISTWLVHRTRHETWRLTTATMLATLLLGTALALAATLLSGPLIAITAPGLDEASSSLAVQLSRILFWTVPLIAVAEVLRALLNALHSFVAPALMHVVLNGVAAAIVIGGVAGSGTGVVQTSTIEVVAWAYLAGAVLQAVFLLLVALRRGYRPVAGRLRDPEVLAVGRLSVRPLLGAALNPLARVIEQVFISFLPPGSITILNYGYRLISAIGGSVLFRSVIVVLLPRLTRATAERDRGEVRSLTRLGVQVMLGLSVPLTALMAVLAGPAVLAVFQRKSFTAADAELLGQVLAVYAISLVGSAVQRAFLAPFFARLDTKVPLRNTVYGVLANLVLIPPLLVLAGDDRQAVIAVALAYSLAQYVNVLHAGVRMRRDLEIRLPGVGGTLLRLLVAGIVMAGVLVAGRVALDPEAASRWMSLLLTAAIGLAGIVVFILVAVGLGLGDVERGFVRLRRKGSGDSLPAPAVDPPGMPQPDDPADPGPPLPAPADPGAPTDPSRGSPGGPPAAT